MDRFRQDLVYALRNLRKSPGYAAVTVLTLALGIGANTAIFSVVNTLLLSPLRFKDPDRLVMVWEKNIPRNRERNVVSPANFLDWNSQNQVFEQMAALSDIQVNLTNAGEPEELEAQIVTASFFPLLGVQPVHGRAFLDSEDVPNAERVTIISNRLWQGRFGADPQLLGKTITLNGRNYTVVGIMPPGFYFLNNETDVWVPMALNTGIDYREVTGRYLRAVARLKPGVTLSQAQAEMTLIASRLEQSYREFNAGWSANVFPLQQEVVGDIRPALLVLLGAVGFVLLIACANVANLLLARAATRQKEFALRAALGASRGRLVRQLLNESLLLGVLGGAAGLALAYWAIELLMKFNPGNIPRLDEVSLDGRVLAFTLGVSVLTGLIFGAVPALQASRPDLNESLKEGGRGTAGGAGHRRLRSIFVVSEVALALVLLVGAGLMIKSFIRLQQVDLGYNPENVLTARVLLPGSKYGDNPKRAAFFKQATERIANIPGVQAAGAISWLPLVGLGSATTFWVDGRPEPPPGEKPATDVRVITPGYFAAMGIPLIKGRIFDERDTAESPRVLIINETMAREFFPGEDPIGKRLIISWDRPELPDEIIGVVGDAKLVSVSGEARPAIYWPHARQASYSLMTFVVRTAGDPLAMAGSLVREIRAIDPEQAVASIQTMEDVVSASIARPRFNMLLLGLFASVAMVLAAVGIYGVMAYSVSQRTHEIGIRMAMGAQRADVLRLIVGQGMALTLAGIGIGLAGAFFLTELMSSLLFGVEATDPLTFTIISLLLACVAFAACYIPARRATKLDPMVALRYE
ncbi:MAG TPA: ABC transporter permease, partial [Blastocatellia bacterium]|nr:ABC transporter permease [Blastocatellia bacterium]